MSLSLNHPRQFLPLVKKKKIAPGELPVLDKIAAGMIAEITKEASMRSGIDLENTGLREAARMNFSTKNFKEMRTSGPVSIKGLLDRMKSQ